MKGASACLAEFFLETHIFAFPLCIRLKVVLYLVSAIWKLNTPMQKCLQQKYYYLIVHTKFETVTDRFWSTKFNVFC